MPISVVCPNCQARLNAPDSVAGKRVKCTKCQGVIAIPAAPTAGPPGVEPPAEKKSAVVAARPVRPAVPVDAPKPATKARIPDDDEEDDDPSPKRSKKPARDDDDDDDGPRSKSNKKPVPDDDDEDVAPKPKKKGKKKSSLPLILVGVALVIFLGCAGLLGVGYLLSTPSESPKLGTVGGGNNTNPASFSTGNELTWVSFGTGTGDQPFIAKFPNAAPMPQDPLAGITDPEQRKLVESAGAIGLWTRTDRERNYILVHKTLPFAPPAAQVGTMLDNMADASQAAGPGGRKINSRNGETKGFPYQHVMYRRQTGLIVLVRSIIANSEMFVLSVEGDAAMLENDKVAAEFFDRFEPKPAAGASPPMGKGKGKDKK